MTMMNEGNTACYESEIWTPVMQQQVFRNLLSSFSYPGRIADCASMETPAWLAILISLLDSKTSLADPHQLLTADMWARLETRRAATESAAFILADGCLAPDIQPSIGTLEMPETGATLLMRVTALHANLAGNVRMLITGPGIKQQTSISVNGLHANWIGARDAWVSEFPLGVDMVLCDKQRFMALPRTTHIQMVGDV